MRKVGRLCPGVKVPSGRGRFVLPGPNPGLVKDGNINLFNRPSVPNPLGGMSSVFSMSFGEEDVEILIPRVIWPSVRTEDFAVRHYHTTGQHLGWFANVKSADSYSERLHRQQDRIYC